MGFGSKSAAAVAEELGERLKQAHSELVLLMIAGLKPHQSKDIEKVKGWLKHDTINE